MTGITTLEALEGKQNPGAVALPSASAALMRLRLFS